MSEFGKCWDFLMFQKGFEISDLEHDRKLNQVCILMTHINTIFEHNRSSVI